MDYNNIAVRLLKRMSDQGFSGYDPSAISFHPKVQSVLLQIGKIKHGFLKKALSSLFLRAVYYGGNFSTRILKPEKRVYAKGVVLVLSGRSCLDSENTALDDRLVDILMAKRIKGKWLWAHDLDYSFPGNIQVTTETPNLITTSFVANSFWDMYLKTGAGKWRTWFLRVVEDVQSHIPFVEVDEDKICFMYTPVTSYRVHNANLHYAELLAKKIHLMGLKECVDDIDLVRKALNYSLTEFKENGAYPYAGAPNGNPACDNYHTGYVLRSMDCIEKLISVDVPGFSVCAEIDKLLGFYCDHFINNYVVRDKKMVLQSHSLAEAILVYSLFAERLTNAQRVRYENAIQRTFLVLWDDKNGYFINNVKRIWGMNVYDRTEMIRWSNAWMYFAISTQLGRQNAH